jgi:membrane associated rhomboid family serine protease
MFGVMVTASGGAQHYINVHGTIPYRFIHHFGSSELLASLYSMFLHSGVAHLLGNMWFLWIFGDNVEDEMGHFKYLFFYLFCGYFADLAHIATNPGSTVPCIGASGAISGVLASYLLMHPNAPVRTYITLLWAPKLPAWVLIGAWFVMQIFLSYTDTFTTHGGVAYGAHIGGFVAGLILTPLIAPWKRSHQPSYETNGSTYDLDID